MAVRADYRDMSDDEKLIARNYRKGELIVLFLLGVPAAALWFGNDKLAFYFAFGAVIYLLNEAASRLFDLAIRLSRANELLVDGHNERRYRKETT